MNVLQKVALLTLLPSIHKIDAIQCSNKFNEAFDVKIDWHEFAYYLDELHRKDILEISKSGGFTQYRLVQ